MESEQAKDEVFDAIHDVALTLLAKYEHAQEVEEGLKLIISISRYQFDFRSDEERRKYSPDSE